MWKWMSALLVFVLVSITFAILMPGLQVVENPRQVILATQRDHRLHVLDAQTLERLGSFEPYNLTHGVSASLDGRRLFIAQASTPDGNGCCALFSLDLETLEMCRVVEPVTTQVPSPDGRWLFSQRGDTGVEVFDQQTGQRQTIPAPGVYSFHPSPGGRWLIGLTNWKGPSVDVFDLEQMAIIRRIEIPRGAGAWVGNQFYLLTFEGVKASLWRVDPEAGSLPTPVDVPLPAGLTVNEDFFYTLIVADNKLLVYQPMGWWFKLNLRDVSETVPGGVFVIEPLTGEIAAHLAPGIDFAQLIPSFDGESLYGVVAGLPPRLVILDARTGAVLSEKRLDNDVWSIALASIPENLIPNELLRPQPCESAEPTPFKEADGEIP